MSIRHHQVGPLVTNRSGPVAFRRQFLPPTVGPMSRDPVALLLAPHAAAVLVAAAVADR